MRMRKMEDPGMGGEGRGVEDVLSCEARGMQWYWVDGEGWGRRNETTIRLMGLDMDAGLVLRLGKERVAPAQNNSPYSFAFH